MQDHREDHRRAGLSYFGDVLRRPQPFSRPVELLECGHSIDAPLPKASALIHALVGLLLGGAAPSFPDLASRQTIVLYLAPPRDTHPSGRAHPDACSLEGNQPTRFEAQVLQGILRKFSNNLNDCIKLRISILEVGEGLLVVTHRYGE